MKVLKNNFNNNTFEEHINSYPRTLICDRCSSELEYDKSDIEMGALGCMYLKCPLCGEYNMLDGNEDNIILTADNIEFPTHFFHTSKETGAVDACNNKEVKKCINNAIAYFREHKDDFAWYSQYGNLYVAVFRYDGDEEYYVIVSNNHYDSYISFETLDY